MKRMSKQTLYLTVFAVLVGLFAAAPLALAAEQVLRLNVPQEPTILDPFQFRDDHATSIIYALHEPLLRISGDGKEWEPGLATHYDVNEDATVYTFYLREDAKWADGTPVTAEDVVYSFQRVVSPEFASPKAFDYFELHNGEAIFNGEKDVTELGVKALDEHTVQFTLARPVDYFIDLLKSPGYAPVQKAAAEAHGDLYGTDPDKIVSSGPFVLTSWQHETSLTLEKNPLYWDADAVALERIEISLISDSNAVVGLYQVGQLDFMDVSTDFLPMYRNTPEFRTIPMARVAFIEFNPNVEFLNNIKIREALAISFDRQTYVDRILAAGDLPAYGLIPPGIRGLDGKDYRETVGNLVSDLSTEPGAAERARALLEEGLAELGKTKADMEAFLEVHCVDNPASRKQAQAIQAMWKQVLGLELRVVPLQTKMLLPMLMNGTFHCVVGGGRTGKTNDPAYFIDFIYYENKWDDPHYTNLIEQSLVTTGNERIEFLIEAEKHVLDQFVFIPQNFGVRNFVVRDGVENLRIYPIAVNFDFKYVNITK
jgi:oligopeptide transport system substrate-binding protein